MHIQPPGLSRSDTQSSPDDPLSVGHARQLVAGWTDLPPTRRRDLTSALNFAERVGIVTLTPAALRAGQLGKSGACYGVKDSRLRNVMSCLACILGRTGMIDQADTPTSESWLALLALLDTRQRAGLIRLARFSSLHQIAPDQISLEVLEAFEAWLTDQTLTPRPRKVIVCARTTWNQACRRVSGWPARPLGSLRDKGQFILPLKAFPYDFRRDMGAFAEQLAANPLDDVYMDASGDADENGDPPAPRLARPLCASTVQLRKDHCRWAASAMVAAGVPLAEVTSLASLVTPLDRARSILRVLYDRAGGKPSAAGTHVAQALRMIAKHHARLPEKDVAQIRRWSAPVTLTYEGMTEKNITQVRRMLEPSREAILLALPEALMRAARSLRPTAPREASELAMRAVLIELLTKTPLRLANIVGLREDRHLQRDNPARGRISFLSIPAGETKMKQRAIRMPVDPQTGRMLQEWVRDFRPVKASADCVYFFPGDGTGNQPMTPQNLREAVKTTTDRHTGVCMTPHQFRHLAAWRYLNAYPGHYEEVRLLLGHASVATTIRHYSGLEGDITMRRFHDLILDRRQGLHQRQQRSKRTRRSKGDARLGGH